MERLELVQRRAFGHEQRLLLGEEGGLRVAIRHPGGVRAFRVDLEELDDSPERIRERSLVWMGVTLLLSVAALAMLAMAMLGITASASGLLAASGVVVLLALVAARVYFSQSVDVLAFCNRYTGQPRVALWHGRPDQASYIAFVESLVARIRGVQGRSEDEMGASLASELRQLQMLVEEGALSHEEFEHTKRRLLGMGPHEGGPEGLH